MSFVQIVTEDIRLVILGALAEDPNYSHNEYVLQSALEAMGHKVSRDRVRTELAWLEEQGLVSVSAPGDITIARLTGRGADVAKGRTVIPGVKRPEPGY